MIKNYIIMTVGVLAFISCEKETEVAPATFENETQTRNSEGVGQAGSMAQFAIIGDYLYTVDHSSLNVFDITDPTTTNLVETVDLGSGIETIFPRNGYLFIGSTMGVKIYDVTNPRFPEEIAEVPHSTSCDPVVANDKFAFSTIRGGTFCGGELNRLDIIKIENIHQPKLVRFLDLKSPHGLALSATDENTLYVCDGWDGFKVLDLYNLPHPDRPLNTDKLEEVNKLDLYGATDVISTENNELIILTHNAIYIYDDTDRMNLVEKSVITIN